MQTIRQRLVRFLGIGILCGLVSSADTVRADLPEGVSGRRVESVGPWAYKRLDRAHNALADEQFEEALAALDEMQQNGKLNSHETSLMWQTLGFTHSSTGDYAKATASFEAALQANGLAEQAATQTRYNLAQLYVMLERYDEAIAEFEVWFESVRNPSPTAYYMLAMAYLQKGDHVQALANAERTVSLADTPREPWLQLLVALRFETKEYESAVPALETLVSRYPKKEYWLQLSAVHAELGAHDRALAILELAYEQGLLTQGAELLSLAQLYLYNQIPYKAAGVLESGLEEGTIESDARAWRLLADSWLNARDRERALVPLKRAADMSNDGDSYVRLGQLQLEREEWGKARESFAAALRKGGLRSEGHVYVMLGIANVNESRWEDAERAFTQAGEHEESANISRNWLRNLQSRRATAELPGTQVAREGGFPVDATSPQG
jgi:tetratricopeptide (TPR) repeat protein